MSATLHAPTRRELLLGSGVLFAWAHVPRIARAEGRDPRFLTIVLRGALDGLAAVAPVSDPAFSQMPTAVPTISGHKRRTMSRK